MATTTNLVIPTVLWGKTAPTHCISCMYLSPDQRTLVTGCYDGQICIWEVNPYTLKMTPRCLLVGHTAPILCLARASIMNNNTFIVSSSESGEMCVWDLVDGKCLESTKLTYVHTNMQAYHLANTEDLCLFCNGYYTEILIVDPFTLEILFSLSSKMNPDWISALHVLRPNRRDNDAGSDNDVVLALTTTGTVKVWALGGQETRASEPIYENESKQIRCLNALHLTCCAYNQRTVLIVCSKYWQIFDAGDFSLLSSVTARRGERWLGGDFIAADRVLVWSDEGRGYVFKLPANKLKGKAVSCIVENKEFRTKAVQGDDPFLYCILSVPGGKPLACPPAMLYHVINREGRAEKHLLRGDSEGRITIWNVPEVTNNQLAQIRQEAFDKPPEMPPKVSTNLQQSWDEVKPPPVGILDQLDNPQVASPKLTASIYLPLQGRLVCGREDGSIIIVPATQTIMLQLLHGRHQQYDDWPPHQLLLGHNGRVNCLLYPHHLHHRYEMAHLVSGGIDFSVCLWDVYTGAMLHRFCVHAGEITQLLAPPNNCSPRILQCICSVASDHSVTLLSLKEKKCVMLASRHLFPVSVIKWRPLDDFMVVGSSDGAVYVWQMETGHLDRVVHGMTAEEVLSACDEHTTTMAVADMGMANPAVHFFRGLRHRNLAAIRHAAQRGLHQLQHPQQAANQDSLEQQKSRAYPLVIQGLRTNPKDAQSHILFFDIEALIVQLLTEEYTALSPATLEAQGLINPTEYQKMTLLTQSVSPDAQKKIADFFGKVKDKAGDMERILKEKDKHGLLAKMKEGAETVHLKIQAKAESVGFKNLNADGSQRKGSQSSLEGDGVSRKPKALLLETNIPMEIARLLLSLLHAWGLDDDLDRVCESKLGLLRPMVPVSFGVLSKGGYMSLQLPTWRQTGDVESPELPLIPKSSLEEDLPIELVHLEKRTRLFTSRGHWELSTTMTTNHLLAIISLSNTLMSMNNATFILEQERARKMHRPTTRQRHESLEEEAEDQFLAQQAQIKQGWSLLATLHCILLPDKVANAGSQEFKKPQVEILARRWQDRCLEVREAAQALLLAELGRLGPKGRKGLVDEWAPFLPTYSEAFPAAAGTAAATTTATSTPAEGAVPKIEGMGSTPVIGGPHEDEEEEEEDAGEDGFWCSTSEANSLGFLARLAGREDVSIRRLSSTGESRRKQATSIVLLGVIGAEFGQDIEPSKRRSVEEQKRKRSGVEGFSLGNNNLARLTSKALMHLLLSPPSRQQFHSPLRRAAIDLIGRGFTVWEPHLDVTKVLLALLDLCCDADKLIPSMSYGLPLTPAADSSRTARHALTLIATARPAAFVTTMAREVARYNTLQQNAQTLNVNLSGSVLYRAKPEILRVIELLIEKMQSEIVDLLVEVMDVILHCLDPGHLKMKGLGEVFPAVCRFHQVNHCPHTRRIAVGAKNGTLAMYELRSSKCQTIAAHGTGITACAFSPDGKFLASYATGENRLSFWQTSTGMFGLGNAQTRCIKTYSTSPVPEVVRLNPLRMARLVWINSKTVTLMLSDGTETRFSV